MRNSFAALLAAAVMLLLHGCGSDSNSTAGEVVLIGKLQAPAATAAAGGMVPVLDTDPIMVSVQEDPGINTEVAADGSFTLRGLPAGAFTLVFKQTDVVIGTMIFAEVAINQQITITVELTGGEIVLVDEDRRGIGHAGIELEGPVQNVIAVSLTGDSRFVIASREVIARPGVTAIRKGTERLTVEDVTSGTRVHVKGAVIADSTDVLAHEIKIQEEEDDPAQPGGPPPGDRKITICHIPPGNPSKKQTISISINAWPAHQAHGDTEGPC